MSHGERQKLVRQASLSKAQQVVYQELVDAYGKTKVDVVVDLVNQIGDADGVWSAYTGEGDEDAVAIIEALFFEIEEGGGDD